MKRIYLFLSIAAAAVLFLFVSCGSDDEDNAMTIEDRIENFFDDINSNKSAAYKNLHPDCVMYNELKKLETWNSYFSGSDYECPNGKKEGDLYKGDITGGSYVNDLIVFKMKENGRDNWKILSVKINDKEIIH